MIDYDGTLTTRSKADSVGRKSDGSTTSDATSVGVESNSDSKQVPQNEDNDDVFSDSDGDEKGAPKSHTAGTTSGDKHVLASTITSEQIGNLSRQTDQLALGTQTHPQVNVLQEATTDVARKTDSGHEAYPNMDSAVVHDIKAIAADASVFTFGDDEDFESD